MKSPNPFALTFVVLLSSLATNACFKENLPREGAALQASLCEIYKNPGKYEGKRILISATITQLPSGKYIYPTSPCGDGFVLTRFDGDKIQNVGLTELESSKGAPGRREFDADVTGIFDSKYAEEFVEFFRYRIIPIAIKQKSPVRIGKPWAAA